MELLAPVGSVDHFGAAVEAGADGVYLGAPGFNARNPARELRFEEIRAMAAYCRTHGLAFYVAINSLVREEEFPKLVSTLAELEKISPSALIVQDLGLIELVRNYFPTLPLHGSTLMFAHSSAGVEALAKIGCSRVVLARELTIAEIERIIKKSPVEVEIFIHGAMCFSYSGGCLFSSYHGGKSGLRGNCVQPCRRKYTVSSASVKKKKSQAKSGYFFSMNDLEAIDLVDEFSRIGISSLKIEGRLRSINYVEQVVRAYRMVLDAPPAELEEIRAEAKELVKSALGRKGSTGFFLGEKSRDIIASHHSGNIGTYCGRIGKIYKEGSSYWGRIRTKHKLERGERFRIHDDRSGERLGFTLKDVETGNSGDYRILLPSNLRPEMTRNLLSLYRVDVSGRKRLPNQISRLQLPMLSSSSDEAFHIREKSRKISGLMGLQNRSNKELTPKRGRAANQKSLDLWLRLDSPRLIYQRLPFHVDTFVLPIKKRTVAEAGQLKRYFGREKHRVVWALPPVVHDHAYSALSKTIDVLIKSGFRTFQIGHLGQLALFGRSRVTIFGDYTLNLLNSRAMKTAASLGLTGFQFSIETDRASLSDAFAGYRRIEIEPGRQVERRKNEGAGRVRLGLTVYGTPPLFIARAQSDHLPYNQVITSPKGEQFITRREGGPSYTRPLRPFSLLPYRNELLRMGLDYMIVDFSGMKSGRKELDELADRLKTRDRLPKLPTFNYLGTLE